MKQLIESSAAWIAAKLQIVGANFDPGVLQWPGGSLLAILLCVYATLAAVWVERREFST
jgi:hypothetical protein